jgi:choline dehydrogenase-like flavoprotein
MIFDAIVVGTGPAGAWACHALRGKNVLALDVGYRSAGIPELQGNLHTLRQTCEDLFEPLIGRGFESLANVFLKPVSLKLKSPGMSYVIRDWERLAPIRTGNFSGVVSFAQGGLANAWGAGVYRFNSRDLAGFPVSAEALAPFYDELTEHIGVCGSNDDLAEDFGAESQLLPPIRLGRLAADILARYQRKKEWFRSRGIAMGHSRLAVLTGEHRGRAPYRYENLEFFRPYDAAVYNPVFTLDALVASGQVKLETGRLVTGYEERPSHVEVIARNLAAGTEERFSARNLLLAAGTLSTTRIVLAASRDFATRRPLLDNPMSGIPLFALRQIGQARDGAETSLAQLNLVYAAPGMSGPLQASFYGTSGPLSSDVLFQLPLSVSGNLAFSKYVSPATAMCLVFYPGSAGAANYIRLSPGGDLEVNCEFGGRGPAERSLIQAFRSIGYLGSPAMCQYPPMGSSLHYAGTLPMRADPGPYETDPYGRLYGSQRVYVCDGACFSALPAKNLTFTIMANAIRIAARIGSTLDQ